MNKRERLNNPPINQVIIAVELKDIFTKKDDIDTFYEKFSLKKQYSKKQEIKSVTFEMGESPKVINDISQIYNLSNEANTEQIQIGKSKLLFVDKNKYTKFDVFFNKFSKILDDTKRIFGQEICIKTIGLRYINIFDFSSETCQNHFSIMPNIETMCDNGNYGLIKNYMSVINLVSSKNENISANVKTMFKLKSNNLLNIVFDIDTKIINVNTNYKDEILKLKEFENNIFFSNFKDIYNIKEFQ